MPNVKLQLQSCTGIHYTFETLQWQQLEKYIMINSIIPLPIFSFKCLIEKISANTLQHSRNFADNKGPGGGGGKIAMGNKNL